VLHATGAAAKQIALQRGMYGGVSPVEAYIRNVDVSSWKS
jgi:hypothetical protein